MCTRSSLIVPIVLYCAYFHVYTCINVHVHVHVHVQVVYVSLWHDVFFKIIKVADNHLLCVWCTCRHSSGYWHERDRERDRDRWSPRRRSRSPHFRDRRRSRSNSPPHRSPRRWMSPPQTAEDRERQKKGIPFSREKCCTGETCLFSLILFLLLTSMTSLSLLPRSLQYHHLDGTSGQDCQADSDHGSI